MRVIAVYNLKGGVGKTAAAVNLAYRSAQSGARTLIWDLDPQGAATFYFRVKPKLKGGVRKLLRGKRPLERSIRATDHHGLDILPSDFSFRHIDVELDQGNQPIKRLAKLIRPLSAEYDHLYLDCAPSISLVSDGIFRAADALLVPTIPTTLSLRTLRQLKSHLQNEGRKTRVLPFFSMVDRRKAMHREAIEARADHSYPFLEATIPYSSRIEQMGRHRQPVAVYAPGSDAANAYDQLWAETMERTGSLMGWVSRWVPDPFS